MSPTYEVMPNRWDQQNRLVRVLEGTHESVYAYDGESHRTRIKELTSSVETKNETFVWCGARICQKRNSGGVVRAYFQHGFEVGTSDYFYTRDHLGSVREVVTSNGTTVASELSYDLWGDTTETGGGPYADFAYTGHYRDRSTGLDLTQHRVFDSRIGRWLSRDPSGLFGGNNLYGFVGNNPGRYADASGMGPFDVVNCWASGGGFARCVDDEGARLKRACRENPALCEGLGFGPERGGPDHPMHHNPVKNGCNAESDAEWMSCLQGGGRDADCEDIRDSVYKECMERAGQPDEVPDNPWNPFPFSPLLEPLTCE